MALTDDARKELQEAVRIVREDRFEKYVRTAIKPPEKETPSPEKDPLIDPEKDPEKDGPEGPPKKEDAPEGDPPKTRRSAWWGELMDED